MMALNEALNHVALHITAHKLRRMGEAYVSIVHTTISVQPFESK